MCETILMWYHQSWNFIGWPIACKSIHTRIHTHRCIVRFVLHVKSRLLGQRRAVKVGAAACLVDH